MNAVLNRINFWFAQLPDLLRRHKIKTWIGFFLVTCLLLGGIPQFNLSSNQIQSEMLKKSEAARQAMERFTYYFGSSVSLILPYRANESNGHSGDIFSEKALTTLKAIQDEIVQESLGFGKHHDSPLRHIVRIRSLINTPYMEVTGDNLFSREFVGAQFPTTPSESDHFRQLALEHPFYPQSYVSLDGQYGAIIIKTDFRSVVNQEDDADVAFDELADGEWVEDDSESNVLTIQDDQTIELTKHSLSDYAAFERRISEIINQPHYAEVLSFSPTNWGTVWETDQFQPELNFTIVGMIVLMLVILLFLFRSLSAIVWPLCLVLLPIGTMIGIAGWFQLSVKTTVYIAISLAMIAGIADSVHILSGYTLFRKRGDTHDEALRHVFGTSALGCFLTSITTALGMLSLVMIPIVDIQNLGILAAFGVIAALLYTLFVLPVMLDLWNPYSRQKPQKNHPTAKVHPVQRLIRKMEGVGMHHPKTVVILFFTITVFFGYHTTHVQVDSFSLNQFKEESPIRKAKELVNEFFGGITSIQVLVETNTENGMMDPAVLNAMEAVTQKIQERYPHWVTKSLSIVDQVKMTFQNLNEGQPEMYRIPQDRSVLEETLFLFNNMIPEDRRLLVTDDYRSASIQIRLKAPGSSLGEEIVEVLREDIAMVFDPLRANYPDLKTTLTGGLVQRSAIKNHISWSQLRSFGLAFLIISLAFIGIFGSVRIGLISIIPNTLPIVVVFGVMGWLDIALDQTTLMVAPILIGIVVDDTIHFVIHYRHYMFAEKHMVTAMKHTFQEAGQAILFTSVILAANFLLLLNVSHVSVARFGLLSTIAIVCALLADFFLLPALVKLFNADFKMNFAQRFQDQASPSQTIKTVA